MRSTDDSDSVKKGYAFSETSGDDSSIHCNGLEQPYDNNSKPTSYTHITRQFTVNVTVPTRITFTNLSYLVMWTALQSSKPSEVWKSTKLLQQ